MKKTIIAVLALVALTAAFTSCGKKVECDICGEVKRCKTAEVMGEEVYVCKDCQEDIEELKEELEDWMD